MRMYKVSLNGQDSVHINFRGSIVILKEGDSYDASSPIYQFYSKYFVPEVHYKAPTIVEEVTPVVTKKSKKTTKTEDININENDVIIETSNQEKE